MRIGVNALFLLPGQVGGTEIYLRSLLAALAQIDPLNEYFVYLNRETGDDLVPHAGQFRGVRCGIPARYRSVRILYEQFALPWLLRRDKIDVLLNPGFTAPAWSPCPSVTVFHDLQHKRHPEFFRWFDLPFWNFFLWLSLRSSVRVIAVSEATAKDLGRYYPGVEKKTVVIHHGVDQEFFSVDEEKEPYLLTVSTLHPHKNVARLLQAFQLLRRAHPEYRLIVAGLRGNASVELFALARELQIESAVEFTGWISRDQLYRLYGTASAFIAPSIFEGFGLPLLEALAAGLPTACSAIPVFAEVAADAALTFDPFSIGSIVAAMEEITANAAFRAAARDTGPARARQFDWTQTAGKTLRELLAASAALR